ncbi:MAG: hypothetical protein KAT34_15105 [Candidatus Aminicenantes bacterium]|nr:hypothetical protein [Candidatus Aminicenantes bacterium]
MDYAILLAIPLGILSSFAASFLFIFLIYHKSRPKLEISEHIAKCSGGGFRIKVVNRTKYPVINVKAELHRIKLQNTPGGKRKHFYEIPMKIKEILVLTKFEDTKTNERYAWVFQTSENLDQVFEEGDYLLFWIVAQSAFSNATKVSEKSYYTVGCVIDGSFQYGPSLKIEY